MIGDTTVHVALRAETLLDTSELSASTRIPVRDHRRTPALRLQTLTPIAFRNDSIADPHPRQGTCT